MKISMIAAMTPERVIGGDNKLLWHLPADLQHFKKLTLGKPVIMGRKTFESIGRPLPGRTNIVLSKQTQKVHPDVVMASTPEQALEIAALQDSDEVMVMGGGVIYQAFIKLADCLYITKVHTQVSGDTLFPAIKDDQWRLHDSQNGVVDEKNRLEHTFQTYLRQ